MYESYFNLRAKPFELLPNPAFIFLSKSHKRAITYLDYGIRSRAGFILLTGDVGTGKTTIIRNLIDKHYERVVLAKIFNTKVTTDQLLAMVNDEFGLPVQGKDKVSLLRQLNDFLVDQYAQGNRPILIIDEAQNLTAELLEEIRLLSNLETAESKLMQIILVGQPELRRTLAEPALLQLRQRISICCHLQPLSRDESEQYIYHRLAVAGNREAVRFAPAALDMVYSYSRGVPRLINVLCDFLLLSAFAEETTVIDQDMAREVVGELDMENRYWLEVQFEVDPPSPAGWGRLASPDAGQRGLLAALDGLAVREQTCEQGHGKAEENAVQEIRERLDSLQDALQFHVGGIDSQVAGVAGINTRLGNTKTAGGAAAMQSAQHEPAPGGFIRRFLGIDSSGKL
jgi:general secretion pathway protein A